jgi:ATP-binding cassette subfamily F protein uup
VILVDVERVGMSRPGKPLFTDLSFTVSSGDRIGIVGLNGCGKSTLLSVLTGEATAETGSVRQGRDVRVAALAQRPILPPGTVLAAVEDAAEQSWEAAAVLDHLGMTPLRDADTSRLSGGQAKRVALARTLVQASDLLVLDEPTNHLDIDAIAWLEDRLASYRGGLILVTHDRHVLDRVTTKVLELDRGTGYIHDGGYDAYLEGRADREEQAANAESSRKILARKELAWLRRGAPARTSKPKARIETATALIETRAEPPARQGIPDLWFGTPRLGDKVIELHDVAFAHEGHAPLFEGVELLLDPRERLGLVGPNGAGKSTLLDLIAGRRHPTAGTVVPGPTARIGYYDQVGVTLDPKQRVRDAVTGGHRQPDWQDAALLESFWFDGDAQWAPIELLSGGERRRLQLLLILAAKPNVLLLDEPTNDLDLDTLRVLEEFLDDWPGALIVVSHDRAFLERTVADVMVMDGTRKPGRRRGGYAAWEDERRANRARGRATTLPSQTPAKKVPAKTGDVTKPTKSPEKGGMAKPRSASTLRHLMKDLDKDIIRLGKKRAAIEATMAEKAGQVDHTELAEIGRLHAEIVESLDRAEEQWLALAEEAEASAAGAASQHR